jgi:hypothetical protein
MLIDMRTDEGHDEKSEDILSQVSLGSAGVGPVGVRADLRVCLEYL